MYDIDIQALQDRFLKLGILSVMLVREILCSNILFRLMLSENSP